MILNFLNNKKLDEAMTLRETKVKRQLILYLSRDGFPKFADYLENFHINFLTSEQAGQPFVAAINAEDGVVLVNPTLTLDAASMVLRHEIAHSVFKHNEHLLAKLKKIGINTPSKLAHELANIAGDYHISNTIYDDADKLLTKGLLKDQQGQIIKIIDTPDEKAFVGLVTEMDFPENPEYWTMDFDQLWDILVKDYDPKELNAETATQQGQSMNPLLSNDFIEGWNEIMKAFNDGELNKEDIEALLDELE